VTNPVIRIYSPIGDGFSFGGDAVTAAGIAKELDAIKKTGARAVDVHVNSEGGNVFEGITAFNSFLRSGLDVTMYIDGLAASAASLIVMAGDTIIAEPSATIMVHRAWTVQAGNADDMRAAAEALQTVDDAIVGIYAGRTGQSLDAVRKMVEQETWLSAEGALEFGFIDSIAPAAEQSGTAAAARRARNRATLAWMEKRLVGKQRASGSSSTRSARSEL